MISSMKILYRMKYIQREFVKTNNKNRKKYNIPSPLPPPTPPPQKREKNPYKSDTHIKIKKLREKKPQSQCIIYISLTGRSSKEAIKSRTLSSRFCFLDNFSAIFFSRKLLVKIPSCDSSSLHLIAKPIT